MIKGNNTLLCFCVIKTFQASLQSLILFSLTKSNSDFGNSLLLLRFLWFVYTYGKIYVGKAINYAMWIHFLFSPNARKCHLSFPESFQQTVVVTPNLPSSVALNLWLAICIDNFRCQKWWNRKREGQIGSEAMMTWGESDFVMRLSCVFWDLSHLTGLRQIRN